MKNNNKERKKEGQTTALPHDKGKTSIKQKQRKDRHINNE